MDAALSGSVVLLLQNSSGASPLATTPTRYKQAWWLGSATDNNAGTIVYNKDADTAKILGGMAPDGYADQSWYRMVEGAQTFLLDAKTLPANWVFGADAAAAVAAAAIWLLRLLLTWLLLLCGYAPVADSCCLQPSDPPKIMMRAIDIVGLSRSKALLFHKRVGKGHIIGTGLNCYQVCTQQGCPHPEKMWVLDRLIRYGGSLLTADTSE